MKWRRTLRVLHRDIGNFVAALTLVYCISGIAVNHIEDWNPNYQFSQLEIDIGTLPAGSYLEMQQYVVKSLNIDPGRVRGHFMEPETRFRVYLDNTEEVSVDIQSGKGLFKQVKTRTLFYELNALHLNNIKGAWTWIADIFAVLLIFLAITGIFIMNGRQGLTGRGKWFLAAGLVVPVVFSWFVIT
ncbi:MAG: hypothetical protein GY732_15175 [Gammaproteobacteria bacterium]|nr:hypothetical protein [Gammaproteobacteria bacterium]